MSVYKPNDARPGDVLAWCSRAVLLIVEVSEPERRVDTVMLMPSERWMASAGERVSTSYSRKDWRRFNPAFTYLSRGWEGVLCPENASGDEGVTMAE